MLFKKSKHFLKVSKKLFYRLESRFYFFFPPLVCMGLQCVQCVHWVVRL